MCVDEATLYADLIERIAKAEYSKKYKALVSDQKSDGTFAVVAINAALKLKKPATMRRHPQAHVEAGEEEEAAEAEAEAEVEATGIRTEDEAMWQAAVAEAALEEEEEDDEAEVLAQAQAEHAAAASLVDSVALVDLKDCMACSRACGERFSHLTMITTCKGFKGQFVCFDREACLARQMSGGGAMDSGQALS
eukprot:jgi/Chrpa1/3227/Chrysochromulina_OHIO_Genome00013808-RA